MSEIKQIASLERQNNELRERLTKAQSVLRPTNRKRVKKVADVVVKPKKKVNDLVAKPKKKVAQNIKLPPLEKDKYIKAIARQTSHIAKTGLLLRHHGIDFEYNPEETIEEFREFLIKEAV